MTTSNFGRPGSRELLRRKRELQSRIGSQIVALREEAGVTQAQLARCAGTAQSHVWKIEAGQAQPSLLALLAIGRCLGADLGVRYFPGSGPRIHDRFQAPMIEALLRVLHSDWKAELEVAVPAARGVCDLVLRRPTDATVVACECHSELRRLEAVLRRLNEKADALVGQLDARPEASPLMGQLDAGRAASRLVGQLDPGRPAARLLLLRSTAATRAIARAYDATFAAAFPAPTAAAVAAIRDGAPWPGSAIIWVRLEDGRAEVLDRPPRGLRVGRQP